MKLNHTKHLSQPVLDCIESAGNKVAKVLVTKMDKFVRRKDLSDWKELKSPKVSIMLFGKSRLCYLVS